MLRSESGTVQFGDGTRVVNEGHGHRERVCGLSLALELLVLVLFVDDGVDLSFRELDVAAVDLGQPSGV